MTRRLLAASLAGVVLAVSMTGTASAAPVDQGPYRDSQAVSTGACASGASQTERDREAGRVVAADDMLPLHRWSGSVELPSRLGLVFEPEQAQVTATNSVTSAILRVGNAAWTVTGSALELSSRFCLAARAGATVDRLVGAVFSQMYAAGVIAGLVGISLVVLTIRSLRRGMPAATVARCLVALALLGAVTGGAARSTAEHTAPMSPGWLMGSGNAALAALAALPATPAVAVSASESIDPAAHALARTDRLSCVNYAQALSAGYSSRYSATAALRSAASVPEALDGMWQSVGLRSAETALLGSNAYASQAACHQLEYAASTSPYVHVLQLADLANADPAAPAFDGSLGLPVTEAGLAGVIGSPRDSVDREVATVWAAACTWTGSSWTVDPGWRSVVNRSARDVRPSPDACEAVWDGQAGAGSWFDFKPGNSDDQAVILAATSDPSAAGARDMLMTLHGHYSGRAQAAAMAYAVSAVLVAVPFLLLAGVVLIAKTALVPLGLVLLCTLLVDACPWVSESRTLPLARHWLSLAAIAFGASLLVAVVMLCTALIYSAGASVIGPPALRAVWAALSPALAIAGIKLTFRKVLHAPDPFSVRGAIGWARQGRLLTAGGEAHVHRQVARARDYVHPLTGGGVGNPDARMERSGGMEPDNLGDSTAPTDRTPAGAVLITAGADRRSGLDV